MKKKRGVLERYFLLLSIIPIIISTLLVALFYYNTSMQMILNRNYSEVKSVAYLAASIAEERVDLENYKNGGVEDVAYNNLKKTLDDISKKTEITYIYYIAPLEDDKKQRLEVLLVAGDKGASNGHHYISNEGYTGNTDVYNELLSVYNGEKKEAKIYMDNENGSVMTASVPVYEDGKIVAVANVDIEMSIILKAVFRNTLYVVSGIILIFVAFLIFTAILIRSNLLKPIEFLSAKMEDFMNVKENTEPDYTPVEIKSRGEIKTIVGSFNHMKDDMKEYTEYIKNMVVEKERIQTELDLAARIQKTALPKDPCGISKYQHFDLDGFMKPAKEVGGDFYDYVMIDETKVAMVIADISGKGIPAALLMMKIKTLMAHHVSNHQTPSEAMTQINQVLCINNEESMFTTAFLGILDTKSGHFIYANAGHNPPVIDDGDTVFLLEGKHDFVLGGIDTAEYHDHEITLKAGTRLLLYTDGVTEAFNSGDEIFGEDRLLLSVEATRGEPVKTAISEIYEQLCEFSKGIEQSDDITMLMIDLHIKKEIENKCVLQAEINQLPEATAFFDEGLSQCSASDQVKNACELIVEELFVNICYYAYEDKGEVTLSYRFDKEKDCFDMCFVDKGKPFNPLEKEDPPKVLDVETLKPGGFGIHLVKSLAQTVEYQYEAGENILVVGKKMERSPEASISFLN